MAPIAIHPAPRATFISKQPPSSLSRKRANHEINSDDDKYEAPIKRLKVAFDPEVEVRMVEDVGEKSLALIRAEVGHAIRQREAGEHEEYENLKQIFSISPFDEDAPSTNLLRKYLLGLISNTVLLKRSVSDLVNTVIKFQWLGLEESFVSLYIRFLGNLVSSHPGYISPVLKMLVENFAHSKNTSSFEMTHSLKSYSLYFCWEIKRNLDRSIRTTNKGTFCTQTCPQSHPIVEWHVSGNVFLILPTTNRQQEGAYRLL